MIDKIQITCPVELRKYICIISNKNNCANNQILQLGYLLCHFVRKYIFVYWSAVRISCINCHVIFPAVYLVYWYWLWWRKGFLKWNMFIFFKEWIDTCIYKYIISFDVVKRMITSRIPVEALLLYINLLLMNITHWIIICLYNMKKIIFCKRWP